MSMFLGLQTNNNTTKKVEKKSNPAYLGIQSSNTTKKHTKKNPNLNYGKSNPAYLGVDSSQKNRTSSKNKTFPNSLNEINFVEGGKTTLYYLKTKNQKGEERYKIGITSKNVKKRYSRKDGKYEILMECKIKRAKGIEKKIKKLNSNLITNEKLLGTKGTEIFSNDILMLDKTKGLKNMSKIKYF